MKTSLRVLLALVTASIVAAFAIAGCGGGDSGGGSSDLASVVPADAPVYVQAAVKPDGDLKTNLESLATKLGGDDIDLGKEITDKIDESLSESGDLTYADDIEPWLGENVGIYVSSFSQEAQKAGAIIQTTDSSAAQSFIDDRTADADTPPEDGSYEGNDYKITKDPSDGSDTVIGVVDDSVVVTDDTKTFEAIVDASKGDSLADNDAYNSAIDAVPDNSLADVYVDLDSFAKEVASQLDESSAEFYNSLDLDTAGATIVASLVPGSDQIEFTATTDSGVDSASTGDASDLLGTFPADSVVAFGAPDVGAQVSKAIDQIDAAGLGDSVKPGQLKSSLGLAGLNLDKFAQSLGSVGFFLEGSVLKPSGAIVMETNDQATATDTLSSIAKLLAATKQPVTAIKGSDGVGFAIQTSALRQATGGASKIYVVTKGDRIAIGVTPAGTLAGLKAASGSDSLADNAEFKSAITSLDGVGINGFVDFTQVGDLIEAAIPADQEGQYQTQVGSILAKLSFLAIGSETTSDAATSKAILKLGD